MNYTVSVQETLKRGDSNQHTQMTKMLKIVNWTQLYLNW